MADKSVKKSRRTPGLRGYVAVQLAALEHDAPVAIAKAKKGPVHRARVATRRLGAVLDLLAPIVSKDAASGLRKRADRLRRRLGELRDLDVIEIGLEPLRFPESAQAWIEKAVHRRRQHAKRRLDESFSKGDLRKLADPSEAFIAALKECEPAGKWLTREAIHAQLTAFAAEVVNVSADLHSLRKSAKRIRFTLEIAVAVGHLVKASQIDSFTRVQHHLGTWHDATILSAFLAEAAGKSDRAEREPAAVDALLTAAAKLSSRGADAVEQFRRVWTRDGDMLISGLRKAIPIDSFGN